MIGRRLHSFALMGILVAANVARIGVSPQAVDDVNGDRRADVLDVQQILGDVMTESAAGGDSDLNGDGVVDILDVQRMLMQVTSAQDENDDAPAEGNGDATPPSPVKVSPTFGPAVLRALDWVPAHLVAASFVPSRNEGPHVSLDSVRYLYGLTPHAPPVLVELTL